MEQVVGKEVEEFYSNLILDLVEKMEALNKRLEAREKDEAEFMKYMLRYAATNQDLTTLSGITMAIREDVDAVLLKGEDIKELSAKDLP